MNADKMKNICVHLRISAVKALLIAATATLNFFVVENRIRGALDQVE